MKSWPTKAAWGSLAKSRFCDATRIAPLAALLAGRGLEDSADWPDPADEAQRQALEQYKVLRGELTHKLGGWKLGSLNARKSEALAAYAKLLRAKLMRLTATAKAALIDSLNEQDTGPLAEALGERDWTASSTWR